MRKRRIFLACSDENLRIRLIMLLDNEPGLIISGFSANLTNLVHHLEASDTDVLLLDWKLPLSQLEKLLDDIHCLEKPPEIMYLSSRSREKEVVMAAGVDYFFTKNAPPGEIISKLCQLEGAEV